MAAGKDIKKVSIVPILILLLLIGGTIRFIGIGRESIWLDEAITVRQSVMDMETSIGLLKEDTHFPLYGIMINIWVHLFGASETAIRVPSLIFDLISIYAVYLIGRKLFSQKTGMVAAVLLAFSTTSIYYSQEARLYTLFLFLTLASFYFYIRLLDKITAIDSIFYLLFSVLMIYTHIFSALTILMQSAWFFYIHRGDFIKISVWLLLLASEFILFLPWFFIMVNQILHNQLRNWIPAPNLYFFMKTFIDLAGGIIQFIILVLLIYIILKNKKKYTIDEKEREIIIMLVLFIMIPILLVLLFSIFFIHLFYPKYFFYLSGYMILLLAYAVTKFAKERKMFIRVLSIIIICSALSAAVQYSIADKPDWRSTSAFLLENAKPGDQVFIYPYYYAEPFTYYFDMDCLKDNYVARCISINDNILTVNYMSKCCDDDTMLTSESGNNELGQYMNETIWLVTLDSRIYPVDNNFYSFLSQKKDLALKKRFVGDIYIYKFV